MSRPVFKRVGKLIVNQYEIRSVLIGPCNKVIITYKDGTTATTRGYSVTGFLAWLQDIDISCERDDYDDL